MIKKIIPYLIGIMMIAGAIGHIFSPEAYVPMVPSFIPFTVANVFATIAEATIGIMIFIPRYQKLGGLLFSCLMLIFLPLHIWDVFRPDPMMGSTLGAVIRLIVQIVFIYGGWRVWKRE